MVNDNVKSFAKPYVAKSACIKAQLLKQFKALLQQFSFSFPTLTHEQHIAVLQNKGNI
jgi:hypothetical protein